MLNHSMLNHTSLFVFLLLIPTALWSQNFFFRQYTSSDGLPANTVYAFGQDSQQILWIGTGNGISKFDGKNFNNYSIEDGLINNVVYGLEVDHLDRKWMTTLAKKPSYFWKGKGGVPSWADSLNVTNYFFQSTDTCLWFSGFDSEPNYTYRSLSLVQSDNQLQYFPDIKVDKGATGLKLGPAIYFTGSGKLIQYLNGQFSKIENITLPKNLIDCQAFGNGLICIEKGRGTADQLLHINLDDRSVASFDHASDFLTQNKANALLVDEKDQIWVGLNNGLLFLQKRNGRYKVDFLLGNVFVNQLFQDHEGNIWVSTEGKGLFFLVSNTVRSLKKIKEEDNAIIRSLETDDQGRIYVGYSNGLMEVFDKDFDLMWSERFTNARMVDILPDKNGVWLAGNGEIIRLDKNWKKQALYKTNSPIKSIGMLGDSLHIFSYNIEVLCTGKIERLAIPFHSRIYSNYTIDDSRMYLGTTEGLYLFLNRQVEKIEPEQIYSDVRGISQDRERRFWIATAGQGLFLLEDNRITAHLTEANGLSSNICTNLLIDDTSIWVATNKGVNKISHESFAIQVINEQDGLSSSEIKYLGKSGANVLAASSGGIDIIPDTIQPFTESPLIHFNQLLVNGDTLPLKETYRFPFDKNHLSVQFTGVSYKSMGDITYAYQLEGLDKDWLETSANVINWSAVEPGDYTLKVKARGSNGRWSNTAQMSISIDLPWWQQWWFKLLMALSVVGVLIFSFWKMRTNYQRKHALQQKMQHLQLTALRAQMNPHFMFNALSSIQEFINTSDLKSANLYLSRFASLVRSVLNNSTREKISLEEEISQLKLYLTLENLRFRQQIQYDIQMIPPLSPTSTMIPTMIIQPFVENALIHGLFHQKGEKKLMIKFELKEADLLHCQIQDNGIGRKRSQEINQKKKYKSKSKGIQLTEDRLALINQTHVKQIAVQILDLQDAKGNSSGTLVQLMIPFSISKHQAL